MEKETVWNSNEEILIVCINKLKEVLNEICSTIDEVEPSIEKLIVSRHLDKLIVEYMNLKITNLE